MSNPNPQPAASPISIARRLDHTKGRPSGFDYMRVVLAVSVICWHSQLTTYGNHAIYSTPEKLLFRLAIIFLPMFFALSGFLVAGSLERSKTLVTFLGLRVLRIIPALAMEVLLSALILGPLVTTLPLGSYFSSPVFHAYFLNILGDIHYLLPGVFESNPFPATVNGQLWTVPWELACYIALTIFAVTGIFKNRHWLLCAMGFYYLAQVGNSIWRSHQEVTVAGGSTLLMSFIAGLVLYRYRDRIAWSGRLFSLVLVFTVILLCIPNGVRFVALPAAYLTVYLGLLNPRKNRILLGGDYSYGLYLYGFPLQQAFMSIGPAMHHWYWNLLCTLPCACMIAVASWWLIEKPVLTHRDKLKQLEDWYLAQFKHKNKTPTA